MSSLTLDNVVVRYGNTTVIPSLSLSTDDAEFLVLLGPSGCGKSTLLRTIAGLITSAEGRVLFDGVDMTDADPRERNVAFVFQSYALYPNLTVGENIAFPLIVGDLKPWEYIPGISKLAIRRRSRSPEVAEKVHEVSALLGLDDLMLRRPAGLSGGQRQRVALARSLVRDPSIFLLDEPLSNLDAKLRTKLRVDIASLQRELQKTFVYVTHDQVEAMTMATKIAVMDRGVVQQFGTPSEIYDHPTNLFVASFVGTPTINLLTRDDEIDALGIALDASARTVGLRPENLRLGDRGLAVTVEAVEDLGADVGVTLTTASGTILRALSPQPCSIRPGDPMRVATDPEKAHRFGADGVRLQERSPASADLSGHQPEVV
ncbi:ABC transporter ATP-binding protein [Microbacterium sp. A84]|uniref:ABC transporter ATP-binding protein n=1 Tax=Microbacterium sp. A84 TaxID=3450715 RepID=UPI003F43F9C6